MNKKGKEYKQFEGDRKQLVRYIKELTSEMNNKNAIAIEFYNTFSTQEETIVILYETIVKNKIYKRYR